MSALTIILGFVEKEIRKANIPIMDTGENPEVPFPRDMIDLEVNNSQIPHYINAGMAFLSGWHRVVLVNLVSMAFHCRFF